MASSKTVGISVSISFISKNVQQHQYNDNYETQIWYNNEVPQGFNVTAPQGQPPSNRIGGPVPALHEPVNHAHHVSEVPFLRKPFPVVDAENLHALVVLEVRKELWGD